MHDECAVYSALSANCWVFYNSLVNFVGSVYICFWLMLFDIDIFMWPNH